MSAAPYNIDGLPSDLITDGPFGQRKLKVDAAVNLGDVQIDQPQNGNLGAAAPTVASQVAGQDGSGNLTTIRVTLNGVEVTDTLALAELQALVAGQLPDNHQVTVSNFPASQTDALTDTELRASPVAVDTGLTQPTTPADTQPVADDYAATEHEADQTGAGAVLTFTVTAAEFVMVDVDNTGAEDDTVYRARATLDGTDPTATTGFVCRSGTTTYLPFPTAGTVKVFAPTGTVVAVQTGRR